MLAQGNKVLNSSSDKDDGLLLRTLENQAIAGTKNVTVNVRIKWAAFSLSEEKAEGESEIKINYPAPLAFPRPTFSMDKIAMAQTRLEEDLTEFGLADESRLKILRAIEVPTFSSEAANIEPLSQIARLSNMLWACLWIVDDLFGKSITGNKTPGEGIPEALIYRFADNCQDIIEGKSEISSDYNETGCPNKNRILKGLHQFFCRFVSGLKELNPDHYKVDAHRRGFSSALRELLLSSIWFNEDYQNNNIQTISDSSFLLFRKMGSGILCVIEYFALAKGCHVGGMIRDDPIFKVSLDSANAVITQLNDLLGIWKEFVNNEPDNLLCHMIRKGTPVEIVAKYIESELKGRYLDYLLLSNRLKRIYKNDQNVINYFSIVDRVLFGQLPFYISSNRYLNQFKWENHSLHFQI